MLTRLQSKKGQTASVLPWSPRALSDAAAYAFTLDEDPDTNDRLFQWDVAASLSRSATHFGVGTTRLCPVITEAKPEGCTRLTVVLDMDETLVFSRLSECASDLSLRFEAEGHSCSVAVFFRPFLEPFLRLLSRHFEVVLFTAADKTYAERVLDAIDVTGTIFSRRLYRDSCVSVDGKFVKDLRVLGRDLARTVILDDSPISYAFQVDNAVPIAPWRGDRTDVTLPKVAAYLLTLSLESDVRRALMKRFGLRSNFERRKISSENSIRGS